MDAPVKPVPALVPTGANVGAWMAALLAAVDAKDTPRFLSFLTDDASFRFANAPAVVGKAAVGAMVGGFLSSIKAVRHDIGETWAPPGRALCEGVVTYTRHDGSTLTAPFVNVFVLRDGLIADYRIYVDASALYSRA
jgi:limonene-1,2-epoxide hydrolase